jgi:nickel/cobalt transporter (NicO) family protein
MTRHDDIMTSPMESSALKTIAMPPVDSVQARPLRHPLKRAAIMAAALAVALALLGLIGWWLGPSMPAPPPRSPFGVGMREAAPPIGLFGGLGSQFLAWQSGIFRTLTKAVSGAMQDGGAAWALVSGSFLYGMVHAAGPGHGKMVIASYIVADGRGLKRGIGLSIAAAFLQALVAITLVAIMALILRATARQVDSVTRIIEMAVFAAIAAAGLAVLWRKAGAVLALSADAEQACAPGCCHSHMPEPTAISHMTQWREMALVVIAAGARPCMGAIVVLTFAASQGLFLIGALSALAMGAGVALATSALAVLAVSFKALALKLAGGRGLGGARAMLALECLAAALVAALGLMLLIGIGTSGAA